MYTIHCARVRARMRADPSFVAAHRPDTIEARQAVSRGGSFAMFRGRFSRHSQGLAQMAIRPILTREHPVLRRKAIKVSRFDASLDRLVQDMWETMYDAPGVGLAAPQIGVPLR